MSNQVIIVGGGLAGLSAAHTVLERGGRVLVLDKNPFMGGNSVKATSGINGATTRTQITNGIKDSVEAFEKDTALSASKGKSDAIYPLGKTLVAESAPAVHWLQDSFNLDLSLVSRLGGHSFPRTHRGKEKFPGFTITYALMEKMEDLSKAKPDLAKVVLKARVTKLLKDSKGVVNGVEYVRKGETFQAHGPVILATGGYGADFGSDSVLTKYRPDLLGLPTTNGDHCTGDGIKMGVDVGAGLKDMECVQVHPTGLVHPEDPNAKVKFLAAEALRGVGGLLLTADGDRFCNELGRRDYVSGEMKKNKGPFRLVLNTGAHNEILWHCKHYQGRGVMKYFASGDELAKEMGISSSKLASTLNTYNGIAKSGKDPYGKLYFKNAPVQMSDTYYVAVVTPIVHYTMGGLHVATDAAVLTPEGKPVAGLFATGELMGGTHGLNRLGGSSLLDCVVYGRVAGDSAARFLLQNKGASGGSVSNGRVTLSVQPGQDKMSIDINWGGESKSAASSGPPSSDSALASNPVDDQNAGKTAAPAAPKADANKSYTLQDVGKHTKEEDVWVVVNGEVLDVTEFLPDHPGGKKAIMLFAGKDASEEFNMLHDPNVIAKYCPEAVIGKLATKASL